MATWRRRAALQAWIDHVDALLAHDAPETPGRPGPSLDLGTAGNDDATGGVVCPSRAERARGWVSLRTG